jgi:uncharacterized membrane protein (DUF106 family)
MKKLGDGFSMILMTSGFIGILVGSVLHIVNQIKNPDMTSVRLLMEHPVPVIIIVICSIVMLIGFKMFNKDLNDFIKELHEKRK